MVDTCTVQYACRAAHLRPKLNMAGLSLPGPDQPPNKSFTGEDHGPRVTNRPIIRVLSDRVVPLNSGEEAGGRPRPWPRPLLQPIIHLYRPDGRALRVLNKIDPSAFQRRPDPWLVGVLSENASPSPKPHQNPHHTHVQSSNVKPQADSKSKKQRYICDSTTSSFVWI
jgi:hypothetical protein